MRRLADVYAIGKEVVGRPEFGPIHFVRCQDGQGAYHHVVAVPAVWPAGDAPDAWAT